MHYAEYPSRADQLIAAGRTLLLALDDREIDLNIAKHAVESAAEQPGAFSVDLQFEASNTTVGTNHLALKSEDVLSGLLLDFQAANLLLATGLNTSGQPVSADRSILLEALQQVETSRINITHDLSESRASLAFDADKEIQSPDLNSARAAFHKDSAATLQQVVDESHNVVTSIFQHLSKVDPAKIPDALNKLGESIGGIVSAGHLIQKGVEKLQNAIDTLFRLLGPAASARAKMLLAEAWNNFTSLVSMRDLLRRALDVNTTEARIDQILAIPDLHTEAIDAATNALLPLREALKKDMNLVRTVLRAVVLSASLLGVVHVAIPWLPLLTATAYLSVLAAALLIGSDYADSGTLLHWVKGVGEIATDICANQ
jgi:hypothetical protein